EQGRRHRAVLAGRRRRHRGRRREAPGELRDRAARPAASALRPRGRNAVFVRRSAQRPGPAGGRRRRRHGPDAHPARSVGPMARRAEMNRTGSSTARALLIGLCLALPASAATLTTLKDADESALENGPLDVTRNAMPPPDAVANRPAAAKAA